MASVSAAAVLGRGAGNLLQFLRLVGQLKVSRRRAGPLGAGRAARGERRGGRGAPELRLAVAGAVAPLLPPSPPGRGGPRNSSGCGGASAGLGSHSRGFRRAAGAVRALLLLPWGSRPLNWASEQPGPGWGGAGFGAAGGKSRIHQSGRF